MHTICTHTASAMQFLHRFCIHVSLSLTLSRSLSLSVYVLFVFFFKKTGIISCICNLCQGPGTCLSSPFLPRFLSTGT
uniref:Putative secreted peptide n=1 Tax=Anopheles braziliensis TaxID=58242 RepID=A0A2M3ZU79_9DIPT